MKHICMRLTALFLALSLALSLAACGGREKEPEESSGSSPLRGMVYMPEDIAWSSDLTSLYDGCASGEWVFLMGTRPTEHGDTQTIVRLPLTGGEAEELPEYQPLEFPQEQWAMLFLSSIRPGEDGTLWVHESYTLAGGSPVHALRRVDENGRELSCFTTQGRSKDLESGTVQGMAADGGGDVAVLTDKSVVLFGQGGELLFSLSLEGGEYPNLVRLGDGRLGVYDNYRDAAGNSAFRLRTVDKSGRRWGETYALPASLSSVCDGSGDVLFYQNSSDKLYVVRAGAEEPEPVVDWLRAGMDGMKALFFTFLPDGRLVTMDRGEGSPFSASSYALSALTPVDPDTLPEKTVLTYATMGMVTSEQAAILDFNKTNQEYYIEVVDYNPENTAAGFEAGRTRLATEITAGKVPDMIDMDALGGEQWGVQGFFEDLWPYIDADPDFGREDLMERVFAAYEEDGKLYGVSSRFTIWTLAGAREVVGGQLTWTPEEFRAALAKLPAGAVALSYNGSRVGMLRQMMARNTERFVDWSAGSCGFESQAFKDILTFCAEFPEEPPTQNSLAVEDMLLDGEQMLYEWAMTSLRTIQEMKFLLGGEVSFVGYPNEEGKVGSAFCLNSRLAITSASEHKDGAWAYLRTQLLPGKSLNKDDGCYFPTNKADFEKMAELLMTPELDKSGKEVASQLRSFGTVEAKMYYRAVTEEEYDQFMELYNAIDSAYIYDDNIMAVITEQAGPCFAGDKSLDETASLIQSRVALYMGEQK